MRLLKAMVMGTAIMVASLLTVSGGIAAAQEGPGPEYREPPYASLFLTNGNMNDEWWDNEELWGGTDDDDLCDGVCSHVGDTIFCEVPTWAAQLVAVGMDLWAADKVIMCHYLSGAWVRIGSCRLDGLEKLRVEGSSHDDNIGIIQEAGTCESSPCNPVNDCDFGEFTDDFESGYLRMYGNGGCDEIWGSQWDDDRLEGEYVWGMEGEDWIYLEDDDVTCVNNHPTALGNEGRDWIYGTAYNDYIWGDWCDADHGSDRVWSYGGSDIVYLGSGGNDYVWGGDGDDFLNGGTGVNDFIYGQNGDDTLWGGPMLQDTCHGGSGDDLCHVSCEVMDSCHPFP